MTFKQLLIGFVVIITLYSCQSEISNTTLFAGDTWNHFIAKEDTIEITNTKTAYDLDISLEVWDNIDDKQGNGNDENDERRQGVDRRIDALGHRVDQN